MGGRLRSSLLPCAALAAVALALASDKAPPTPTPSGSARTVKQADLIERLSDDDRQWLSFVAPIILPAEVTAFLELTEPREREQFKDEFWKRREQNGLLPPLGPGYRFRYPDLRQLADSEYDRWPNEAAMMVIRYGEPDVLHSVEGCERTFREGLELWTYNLLKGQSVQTRHYLFYRRALAEPRRLWVVGTPESYVLAPGSCRKSLYSLIDDCTPKKDDPCFGPVCGDACEVFKVWFENGNTPIAGGLIEKAQLLAPADVSLEGLDGVKKRSASSSDPNAAKVGVEGPRTAPLPRPTAEPEEHRELSRVEILERIARLEPKYRKWLNLAAPLLTEHEISDFLQLSPNEKDRYIRRFWKVRS